MLRIRQVVHACVLCFLGIAAARGQDFSSLRAPASSSIKQHAPLPPLSERCVLRSGNRVLAVQVRCANDTSNGVVSSAGLFNIGTAKNQTLLFDFPHERYTSHLNVWLDGRLYSNDSSASRLPALQVLQPPFFLPDSTIACQYQAEKLIIEQRLRPEQYSDSTGAIFMQYLLINRDSVPHEVGLLLELDTKVVQTDSAAILTSFGYSDREAAFYGAGVPDFFQAFEFSPPQQGLVAQGTLAGFQATRPDLFAIGDWVNLRQVKWDFTPGSAKYNDSAVLLRWDPQPLAAGQTRALATYYGLGQVATAQGDLSLSLSAPAELRAAGDTLTPNPFSVSLLVTNTGLAAAQQVRALVELPEFLSLVEGEAALKILDPPDLQPNDAGALAWRVRGRCAPRDTVLKIGVRVFAQNTPDNFVAASLRVPACPPSGFTLAAAPDAQAVTAGDSAVYAVHVSPAGNFSEAVALELWPEIPGIDASFTPRRPLPGTSAQLRLQTAPGLVAGMYSFAVNGRSGKFSASDTISLQVLAAGIDREPPRLSRQNPAPGGRNVLPETTISFEIHDEGAGVDSASLLMLVNGQRVRPRLRGEDLRLLFAEYLSPSPFDYGEEVQVAVRVADRADPAHEMEERYSFFIQEAMYDLIAASLRPEQELQAGLEGKVRGEVRNGLAGVAQPFRVLMQADQATIKDTTMAALAPQQTVALSAAVRFTTAGRHEITMQVDADGSIAELSEDNNQQTLLLEILPAAPRELVVKPNPFTPNDDGYNDVAAFDYAGLDLQSASLKIFDVEGVSVQEWEEARTGVITWDGRDRHGRPLPPGIYFYSLRERGNNVANGYIVLAR